MKNSFELYMEYMIVERNFSKATIETYSSSVKSLLNYLEEEEIQLNEVTKSDINEYIKSLSHLSPVTLNVRLNGIKSFFHFLYKDELIEKDPAKDIELSKVGRHLPDVLSIEEVNMMLDSFDEENIYDLRNKTVLEVLYSAGLRVSELCNLKTNNN